VSPPVSVLFLLAGIGLVVAGAELFFAGLLAAAARVRVAPFVLAAVVSGLELENLAAGIAANAHGLGSAAAGTFLGGTTFVALAVAGTAALVAPFEARLPPAALVWTAAAPFPLLAVALDGRIDRLEGGLLLAWFAVSLTGLARSGRRLAGVPAARPYRLPVARALAGLAVLTGGGELLGSGLHGVVTRLGVSQSLLGNTAVAAAVEAEELGRVAVPARRGRPDVAVANLLGTVVHFVGLNAGVIALVRPLRLDAASVHLHLPVAVAAPLLLTGALAGNGGLGRLAGAGLLGAYVAYVTTAIVLAVT